MKKTIAENTYLLSISSDKYESKVLNDASIVNSLNNCCGAESQVF